MDAEEVVPGKVANDVNAQRAERGLPLSENSEIVLDRRSQS